MRKLITKSNYWVHLPRAMVAFSGLYVFHLLAGDALVSWSLIGIAAFALIARTTGSLENRSTRIELSIAMTACVLIFLHGGFINHFNSFSLPLALCTAALLAGLNALNLSIPQARVAVVPILLILFFVSQRYFYPYLTSEFSNPLVTIILLAAVWELLSSLVYAKKAAPSILETSATITLLFFYYSHTADFPVAGTPFRRRTIGVFLRSVAIVKFKQGQR